MTNENKKYLMECASLYHKELCEDVMPFWMKNGVDRVNGGIYTCVDRDGTLMDTTKSVWFQGRWGWTAAAAYNRVERREEWLEASKSAIDFIEKHCIDTDGHMFFTVTAEGAPVQKRRYVFSESFAAIAMAEYAKATGDRSYAEKALEVFRSMKRMLSTPGFLEPKTTVEGRGHSITMILINVAAVLKGVIEAPELDEQIDNSINDIERYLMNE
jgi:N-acylglucosamine 2-epimerase